MCTFLLLLVPLAPTAFPSCALDLDQLRAAEHKFELIEIAHVSFVKLQQQLIMHPVLVGLAVADEDVVGVLDRRGHGVMYTRRLSTYYSLCVNAICPARRASSLRRCYQ